MKFYYKEINVEMHTPYLWHSVFSCPTYIPGGKRLAWQRSSTALTRYVKAHQTQLDAQSAVSHVALEL